jgi:phosphoglycerol transferase
MRILIVYFLTILACSLIVVLSLGLWNADLRIPFYYTRGRDAFFLLSMCKAINETGWFTVNPRMDAPGIMTFYDYPCDAGIFLRIKLINAIAHNPFITMNALYLMTFPLVVCTSLYSYRELGIQWPTAVAASLLFCFTPYHYWRGMHHLPFTGYEAIPLIALVALRVSAGDILFFSDRNRSHRSLSIQADRRPFEAILVAVWISLSGIYFAYFGVLLLSIAGLIRAVRHWSRRALLDVVVLISLIVASLSIQLAPSQIYAFRHGRNQETLKRDVSDYYTYGLRLNNMVMPSAWHRMNNLAQWSPAYPWKDTNGRGFLDQNEAVGSTPLGLVGTFGLAILLLAGISSPAWLDRRLPTLANTARITTALLLFALIGGGSEMVTAHITYSFRGINRISIIIECMCLLTIGLIVDRALRTRKSSHVCVLLLAGTILALLDQIPSGIAPDYAQDRAAFRADESFVRSIEASVASGGKIFQLPVLWFPEFGGVGRMEDYNHLRGYLHSDRLCWSFGAAPGRSSYRWQLGIAALPPSKIVARLSDMGFEGIYINTFGYDDGARELIEELRRNLGTEPISGGAKGELRFFRLPGTKRVSSPERGSGQE